MNYYMFHSCGIKKVNKKIYKAHTQYEDGTPKLRDVIDWYDDGKNLFFGWAALDEKQVISQIVNITGIIKTKYCLWGI